MRFLVVWAFLIAATPLEASGNAFERNGLFNLAAPAPPGSSFCCSVLPLLFGYGTMLSLAPQPFEHVVGLYIATLFCVRQVVISFIAFGSVPTLPILIGGALIVVGGLIASFGGLLTNPRKAQHRTADRRAWLRRVGPAGRHRGGLSAHEEPGDCDL